MTKTLATQVRGLAKGTTVAGKYRILEEIGRGGMGVVYEAEDIKLKRPVALKFLPPHLMDSPELKARFIIEAQAAAALSHPNICVIHEVGETEDRSFIAMEYVEGETLRDKIKKGPLKTVDAIDITSQIAAGLGEAHRKGIIHRDIKSANIMVTDKGQAKVMDFGLAKLRGGSSLTKSQTTMGTVAYMSPEQAQGKAVDHRTDIWSLGIVMYEMLAGVLPFKGDYDQTLIHSILHHEPERLAKLQKDLPAGLENIIFKALSKIPADRYQTMDELLEDLKAVAEGLKPIRAASIIFRGRVLGLKKVYAYPITAGIVILAVLAGLFLFPKRGRGFNSIAVLPLENLSRDPEQEPFSDGMHEALIMELSRIKAIKVISRTSVMGFRGSKKKIREIARELGVAAIVEGSTVRSGNMIRINVQLIDGRNDEHIWADKFDREYRDILTMQSEAAMAIAREIQASLTPEENKALKRARPVNPEAHELYLKGLYHYNKWTKEGWEKAIEYFQGAIKIDPNHAQALATLADSYGCLGFYGYLRPEEANIGHSLLMRALEIDETLAEAHRVLAHTKFYTERDWVSAEKEYLRAIELNPSYSAAHFSYAWYLISQGLFEKALAEAKRGQELDPLSVPAKMTVGDVYYYARRYDQAIAQYQQLVEMEPNYPDGYGFLAQTYEQMRKYEDAVKARQKEMTLTGSSPEEVAALARVYGQQGPNGYWMWRLQKLRGRSAPYTPYTAAEIHAHLGNKDEAMVLLERAYQDQDFQMVFLKVQAEWDSLRDDPRFQKLLRLMKYPEN